MSFGSTENATDAILDVVESGGRRPLRPSSIQTLAQVFEQALAGAIDPAQALHALGLDGDARRALRDRHVRMAAKATGELTPWSQARALSLEIERLDWEGWPTTDTEMPPVVTELRRAKSFGHIPNSERQLYRIICGDATPYT